MGRSRGSFGNPHRHVVDHFKTLAQASVILESEHGTRHKSGEHADLCPKCIADAKADQKGGGDAPR